MNVIHVSTVDYGGAYIATERISKSLCDLGINSKVLVRSKTKDNSDVIEVFTNPIQRLISKVKNVGNLFLSNKEIVSDFLGTDISKMSIVKASDIIVLHWINSFISYNVIKKLLQLNKPIVFVLHDTYLFTGGCHIMKECQKYQCECDNCPFIKSIIKKGIARKNLLVKKKIFEKQKAVFVGPSKWIVECANKSSIFHGNNKIIHIPNPIDNKKFRPIESVNDIKEKFGINTNKKIIMYGAIKAMTEENKGAKYLEQITHLLPYNEFSLVVFGNVNNGYELNSGLETKYLGHVDSEEELARVYNCADIYLSLSMQESFGQTVSEALACGVYVVAFGVGGILDQIEHKKNGYLAEPQNVKEIIDGIYWCFFDKKKDKNNLLILNNTMEQVGITYSKLFENLLIKM